MTIKKQAFRILCAATHCAIEDTVVIAGTERSGTTWLFELLAQMEGYRALHEPLTGNPFAQHHGFEVRNTIDPLDRPAVKTEYMRNVLRGVVPQPSCWRFSSKQNVQRAVDFFRERKVVVKFVRANRMLMWLGQTFSPRGIIFIVRHPCAVVASMKHFARFKPDELRRDFGEDPVRQAVQETLPTAMYNRYQDILTSIDSYVGVLAALWCLDHVIPFHHHLKEGQRPPWHLVSYEEMVLDPLKVIQTFETHLGLPVDEGIRRRVRDESSSVWKSQLLEPQAQVEKWKTKLSRDEIDDVLAIVRAFGLDNLYDDSPFPHLDLLRHYSSGIGANP